ncbi:MliC family protein [Neisseria weaveri]|uniref:Lipoprotein n=1 Tax=Neisseria weaveri TaxID=28091 RepID=A0A3S5C499_9NEIS|nr:MliC family protein [Neisseria weaveri]EGV36866.1 hypothetical protein l13_05690 [Neisseria weaveri ATCC 51223]EGV38946.1 hypothetical protein l11_00250 [Neisseria weaveri LMG 5135]SAY52045.1 lipoprotein [Neisseria weaveri]VEJ51465.1 lipoprotein [Neisseria weaveri]
MKLKALLALTAASALSACVVLEDAGMHTHKVDTTPKHFSCDNGLSVQVRNVDHDKLELKLDDKAAVLTATTSASGELYTSNQGLFGHGAEWHQKGNEAYFEFTDPYHNKVNTTCNMK